MSSGIFFGIFSILAIISVQIWAQDCSSTQPCPSKSKGGTSLQCCNATLDGTTTKSICVYSPAYLCSAISKLRSDSVCDSTNCNPGYSCCSIGPSSSAKGCAKAFNCPT